MGEIDFKKNKQKMREMYMKRVQEDKRAERKEKVVMIICLIMVITGFILIYNSLTKDAINSCIEAGNSEKYCTYVTM